MSSIERWFPYRRPAGEFELFAVPHAGASSTVFKDLRDALQPDGVTLTAAVLPGHGRRLREQPHRRMDALLAEFRAVAEADGYAAFRGDYALLGHCSGALVAYEIARLLVQAPCRDPQLLVVCSCLPPRLVFDTGFGRLPTRQLLLQTAEMGGMAEDLMADADFLQMLERPLRADWELYDGYVHRPSAPMPVPILAVRGTEDPNVDAIDLRVWREQTSGRFTTAVIASDHWALDGAGAGLLAKEITSAVAAVRAG